MKKIGIMTFLHNDNYGSTLQAWALQQALKEMGVEPEHLDYRPSGREKMFNLLRSGNSPRLVLEGLKKRSVRAGHEGARDKSAAFEDFRLRRMALSPVCRDRAALKQAKTRYDALLCGSDQIWSPVWLNPAYFLDFAGDTPRIAYAASMGVSTLRNNGKKRRVRRLTDPFRAISMREEEGAALLRGITGRTDISVMPDPVCLLDRERWLALAGEGRDPVPDGLTSPVEHALVCYFLGDRPEYWQQVSEIAKTRGLTPVVVPVTENSWRQGLPLLAGLSPESFLKLLAGADLVCTDSFHCTALAALLGRPFISLKRDREDDPESKNSRVDQLMRHLSIRGRAWDGEDPERLEECFAVLREQGISWLQTEIEKN